MADLGKMLVEEDITQIHRERLLMHFWVTGPGQSCPLTSEQERLRGKVTKLTKFGHPPSLLETFFRYPCFQAGAHCLVTLLLWHRMIS